MKHFLLLFFLFPLLIFSQVNLEKAQQLFDDGKFEQAKPLFEALLKKNPSNIKIMEYLGDIAGRTKDWDEALLYYGKLKKIKPQEADFYFKYGGVLGMKALEVNRFKALGMIDEVRSNFEKAIELNPKHIEARWALIELNLQLPGILGGSEKKAIQYSNELLQISAVDAYLSRGHIEEYFKRYTKAEQWYKKAITVGNSKKTYQKLANLYANKMKSPEKAQAVLEEFRRKSTIN
ncbi:tetratricopeptide repeat protein [Flavobacterium sp. FZUC8N2.13]|uniref:Tetratricopeptide repeat protein n=1 Tax=Flavobacterium zubiriense TaxID=3138075 RepID=A0ABV4T6W3_9FLAO